jgi:hypothetical protein
MGSTSDFPYSQKRFASRAKPYAYRMPTGKLGLAKNSPIRMKKGRNLLDTKQERAESVGSARLEERGLDLYSGPLFDAIRCLFAIE